MTTTLDLSSPAVSLAIELEQAGLEMRIADDDQTLQVRPREGITPDLDQRIRTHRHELLWLLRVLDDEVIRRRDHFKGQWLCRLPIDPIGPQFIYKAHIVYAKGVCFACGDPNGDTWGRCWRCRLAWRLAVGVAGASDVSLREKDTAKVVA